MDRRSYFKTSLALGSRLLMPAGVLALVGCSGTSRTPELGGFDGKIMGTGYSVLLGQGLSESDPKHKPLAQEIHAVLQDVDTHMSTWRADSELSLFNDSKDGDWQAMTPATTHVIAHALDISAASKGAFDVTVGPLVDLWGFGAQAIDDHHPPSTPEINEMLRRVGYDQILIRTTPQAIRKTSSDVYIDLSAIAKGYAVDRVAALLNDYNIGNYLVEIGGELRARGLNSRGVQWTIAIERPAGNQRSAQRLISLGDLAVATSGNYRNYFEYAGQQYSHLIDPRSGSPVRHSLASVTVINDSATYADALATALLVLGPKAGFELAKQEGLAVLFIIQNQQGFIERSTSSFDALVAMP